LGKNNKKITFANLKMMEKKLYTIAVYSENNVGLLNQVSIIFTRRKLNIESLTVSASAIEGVHKFTITTVCSEDMVDKVVQQIERKIDVLKAYYYTDDQIISQEIALYKVKVESLLDSDEVEKLIRKHNARILEITRVFTAIEKTGHYEELMQLYKDLKPYGVLQFVRSGRVAITTSPIEKLEEFLKQIDAKYGDVAV
jgi:acetolactate synthase-1/3 small subunit